MSSSSTISPTNPVNRNDGLSLAATMVGGRRRRQVACADNGNISNLGLNMQDLLAQTEQREKNGLDLGIGQSLRIGLRGMSSTSNPIRPSGSSSPHMQSLNVIER
ncbi:hypothetical protein MRB53_027133 [Persea americana]|uniref:Uncharacterized protein n=1 Tax=Persea americana TaxID=3435 RepID=A0ACC2LL25_PERAE|nr:hypothetical protein MRB53_027133 [Persea americana]